MALVGAAILPHSPLLVPNIGKENTAQFKATLAALSELKKTLDDASPETFLVLTSKGPIREDGFTFNIAPEFKANLEPFGDLVTHWQFNGDVALGGWLREKIEQTEPLNLVTDFGLDYASAISLSLLGELTQKPILPLTIGQLPLEKDLAFGKYIQKYILETDKRIAIIASVDLSHRLNKKSPTGYSPKSKKFDQKIIEILKDSDSETLVTMTESAREVACEDLAVLATLLGLLDDIGCQANVLSYEAPFGVGHAMVQYHFGSPSPL